MLFYGQEPIIVSFHPAKFCGYKHSSIADIIILVHHVILMSWRHQHLSLVLFELTAVDLPPCQMWSS